MDSAMAIQAHRHGRSRNGKAALERSLEDRNESTLARLCREYCRNSREPQSEVSRGPSRFPGNRRNAWSCTGRHHRRTVTDPSGAAVPNASITLTNTDTGQQKTINTNGEGQYVAADIRIGRYIVRAQAAGFKVGEKKDVVLQVGDRSRIDFRLEVGNAQETITVEADPVAVQTDSGEVSGVITGQQISQLSTNGRSIFTLEP